MADKYEVRPHSSIQLGDATDNWDVIGITNDEGDLQEDLVAVGQTESLAKKIVSALTGPAIAYKVFLVSRIFTKNDYGSVETLLSEISKASSITDPACWRQRKNAFNVIAEKAPMADGVYGKVHYHEVVEFLDSEVEAFENAY